MGITREETGLPKVRNRTCVPVVYYPAFALAAMLGFALGSNAYTQSTINQTLKLCNQKPLECKFKYDVLMYEETGKVPYTIKK